MLSGEERLKRHNRAWKAYRDAHDNGIDDIYSIKGEIVCVVCGHAIEKTVLVYNSSGNEVPYSVYYTVYSVEDPEKFLKENDREAGWDVRLTLKEAKELAKDF